jgi:hypothetical protein
MVYSRGLLLLGALLSVTPACYQGFSADDEDTGTGVGPTAATTGPTTGSPTSSPTSSPTATPSDPDPDTTSPSAPTSDDTGGPICPPNTPPAAPTIMTPGPDRLDITAANLSISGSAFSDPDPGDVFGGVEVEILRVRKGAVAERVWHAELAGVAPPFVTLANGEYDDNDQTALEEWEDHVIRMRYRDERAECSDYGPWSQGLEFRTDDGSTVLFDDTVVRDFYLDIPPASWTAINAEATPPGCVPFSRSYHPGTLRYEDQTFLHVGIKIKGGCGSSRDLSGKPSFKVNLSWDDPNLPGCPAERRLLGEQRFTFNNGVQDNSASHERMGYSIYRDAGVPTPRIATARVFVNDELWGVYQHVETIDRRFLSRWFESKEGMLYEGTYWCDLVSGNLPPDDNTDSTCLSREYSPGPCTVPDPDGDPLDYSPIRAMITQVEALPNGSFYPAITEIFDFDAFLTTWAVESIIAHWDNYGFKIKNNYRVYHDPATDRWTLLATGIDQTFNQEQDPWGVEGVIAVRCLAEPACEAAFAARLHEVNDLFESTDLAGRAAFIYNQISPFVMEDPRKEYDFATFQQRHQDLLNFIAGRPAGIRSWLTMHGY